MVTEQPPLEVRCERHEGAVVAVVRGEIDYGSADRLRALLRAPNAQAEVVVLDLRELTFIDSSGLSVVVGEEQRAREEGFRFVLAIGGAPGIERVFELAGLRDTLTMVDDPAAALTS